MKKFRNYILVMFCCLVAASAMTSCLGNSEDNSQPIDAATQKQYMMRMSGLYSGKIKFWKQYDNYSTRLYAYDSVAGSWRAGSDSLITVNTFPVNKLDSAIDVRDTSVPADLKDLFNAIKDYKGYVDLKSLYYIPDGAYVQNGAIQFFVNPITFKIDVTVGGKPKEAHFVFYANSNYGYGVWKLGSAVSTFQFQAALYQICLTDVGGTPTQSNTLSSLYNGSYLRQVMVTFGL